MFHHMLFNVTAGVNDANVDMTAVTDSVFITRNNHFIFTDPFALVGWAHMGASVLRARFNVPSLNIYARQHVWPVMRSATPSSPPRIMDLRDSPILLPVNEEIAIEESGNLGAATEPETSHLWVVPAAGMGPQPPMIRNMPRGIMRIVLRATAALTRVATSWATGGALTFEQSPRGGWYAVVAAYVQSTTLRAFRLFFPRQPLTNNRQLRPGYLVHNAVGDLPSYMIPQDELGVWGVFHTFEPPLLEVYADAGGADTQEVRLDCVYLGDSATQPAVA